MTYRALVLPNGRIDTDSLPDLPPGTFVDIAVPKTVESLQAFFRKMEELGKSSQEIYRGQYSREHYYEDED